MRKSPLVGVSVVIPSYNCKKYIFRLLDSLKKSTYPKIEVIVVDNGSKDGTLTSGRRKYQWVKWVDAGIKNIGQTGCYNLGFAMANKKHHLLYCDADVVVDKSMITKLAAILKKDKGIGIVTPMILYLSDKDFVNQAGAEVNLTTGRVKVGWGPKRYFFNSTEVQNSGTVMLLSRKVVERIGGMENWFMCYFDSDYCLRAKKAGFKTWYTPDAIAYHDQSKDPNVWRPRVLGRAYLLGRNRVLFIRRHGNIFTFTIFLPLLLGYYLIESIRFSVWVKFMDLIWGTFVGYFYPLTKENKVTLPEVKNHDQKSLRGD